jgi:hypothetical protein
VLAHKRAVPLRQRVWRTVIERPADRCHLMAAVRRIHFGCELSDRITRRSDMVTQIADMAGGLKQILDARQDCSQAGISHR